MSLGFHVPVELLPREDGHFDRASHAAVKFIEDFMTRRHVPGWVIANMERAGPEDVAWVSAIKLAEERVLTGLLNGDAEVSLKQAKWLWTEKVVRNWSSAREPISAVYDTIASQAGFVVDQHADHLYSAMQDENFYLFNEMASAMTRELVASAVAAADDKALMIYLRAVRDQLDYLIATADWNACRVFLDAETFVTARRLPMNLTEGYAADLTSLLKAARRADWKAHVPPGDPEHAGRELLSQARAQLAARDTVIAARDRSNRGHCLIAREAFRLLVAGQPTDARTAFGWLDRYWL
jgi:hypothetical protein